MSSTYLLSDVNLADAVTFVEKAKTRVNMPDAVIGFITVEGKKSNFDDKDFRIIWDIYLKKGVNDGRVEYDNDGREVRASKNGKTVSNNN